MHEKIQKATWDEVDVFLLLFMLVEVHDLSFSMTAKGVGVGWFGARTRGEKHTHTLQRCWGGLLTLKN